MYLYPGQCHAGPDGHACMPLLWLGAGLLSMACLACAHAATPPPTDGWELGGAIRGRYDLRFNDAAADGRRRTSEHISFDTLLLTARYSSATWFGAGQYRLYGGSFLYDAGYRNYPGELSFPLYAYVGRHFGQADSVTFGLQPVPFDDTFWGSAFLNSLGFVYGLEEAYSVGVSHRHQWGTMTTDLGVFPVNAANAFGISHDSARYSVNLVNERATAATTTRSKERNLLAARLQYRPAMTGTRRLTYTGSAWYSTVDNRAAGHDGKRRAVAISAKLEQGRWRGKLLAAWQDIDSGNPAARDAVTVGNFDGPFDIAARGTLGLAEVGRRIDTGGLPFTLDVYASYARFFKTAPGYDDTQRLNIGAFWSDSASGQIRVWSEVLVGRNDPFVGAGQYSTGAAQGGDDHYKTSLLMVFGYYF